MRDKQYYLYMMTNDKNTTLYTGMTNDLERRVYEHKNKITKSFTSRYNVKKLVYFEIYNEVDDVIAREKQIKKWSRKRKNELVENSNINWKNISESWTDCHVGFKKSSSQ